MGIPALADMIATHGCGETWQKATMLNWCQDIASRTSKKPILFEGQIRPSFIPGCADAAGLDSYEVLLVDCSDNDRRHRLCKDRGQPELADFTMMDWARIMREEADVLGYEILNASVTTFDQCIALLLTRLLR